MINNNNGASIEVKNMAKAKRPNDVWEEIIDSLVLESEPPIRYIKDAVIVTKYGVSYRLSPTDFAELVEKERAIPPEQSDIQHCSVNIDFIKLKRDVNKWANDFIKDLEKSIPPVALESTTPVAKSKAKKPTAKKTPVKSKTNARRKVD